MHQQQVWRTWVKVKIVRHVFANNFFLAISQNFFKISVKFCLFLIPMNLIYFNENFFALISTFCKLWLQMRTKQLKKRKTFLCMCLRILLGNHQRVNRCTLEGGCQPGGWGWGGSCQPAGGGAGHTSCQEKISPHPLYKFPNYFWHKIHALNASVKRSALSRRREGPP
jgi:hypothetical protein